MPSAKKKPARSPKDPITKEKKDENQRDSSNSSNKEKDQEDEWDNLSNGSVDLDQMRTRFERHQSKNSKELPPDVGEETDDAELSEEEDLMGDVGSEGEERFEKDSVEQLAKEATPKSSKLKPWRSIVVGRSLKRILRGSESSTSSPPHTPSSVSSNASSQQEPANSSASTPQQCDRTLTQAAYDFDELDHYESGESPSGEAPKPKRSKESMKVVEVGARILKEKSIAMQVKEFPIEGVTTSNLLRTTLNAERKDAIKEMIESGVIQTHQLILIGAEEEAGKVTITDGLHRFTAMKELHEAGGTFPTISVSISPMGVQHSAYRAIAIGDARAEYTTIEKIEQMRLRIVLDNIDKTMDHANIMTLINIWLKPPAYNRRLLRIALFSDENFAPIAALKNTEYDCTHFMDIIAAASANNTEHTLAVLRGLPDDNPGRKVTDKRLDQIKCSIKSYLMAKGMDEETATEVEERLHNIPKVLPAVKREIRPDRRKAKPYTADEACSRVVRCLNIANKITTMSDKNASIYILGSEASSEVITHVFGPDGPRTCLVIFTELAIIPPALTPCAVRGQFICAPKLAYTAFHTNRVHCFVIGKAKGEVLAKQNFYKWAVPHGLTSDFTIDAICKLATTKVALISGLHPDTLEIARSILPRVQKFEIDVDPSLFKDFKEKIQG